MNPKPQKSNRKKLVKELDRVFSIFIRQRDKRCVTCKNLNGLPLTCGHLFSRVAYSTRWDELNCHCQCTGCNMYHEHNAHRFTGWFIKKFGVEKYELLSRRYAHTAKLSNSDIEVLIRHYKAVLK